MNVGPPDLTANVNDIDLALGQMTALMIVQAEFLTRRFELLFQPELCNRSFRTGISLVQVAVNQTHL